MKRRRFIRNTAAGAFGAAILPEFLGRSLHAADAPPDVVWVENGEPGALLNAALQELGGIGHFIKSGDRVVVKPNIGWDRAPQFAATTNPDLIAGLVKACLQAGADKVKVFDRTCNNPRRCYNNSQIEEKAKAAGADVVHIRDNRFKSLAINGSSVKDWPIYEEYLEADKIINVPIAKHHSLSRVTLGLKNLMGVMGGNRGSLHSNFSRKITEICGKILPTLTVIDAYRILTANGPVGGNLDHVQMSKTLIASPCTVSADFAALELFGLNLHEVEHIRLAAEQGLSRFDLQNLNIRRIRLS